MEKMNVLRILRKGEPENLKRKSCLRNVGIYLEDVSPTPLSAITALKASKIIRKKNIDIVEASGIQNAIAAVSAKKLSGKKDLKVAVYTECNSDLPKAIHEDLKKSVDIWIFESRRIMDCYPDDIRKLHVGKTYFEDAEEKPMPDAPAAGNDFEAEKKNDKEKLEKENPNTVKNVLWIGDILNTDYLRYAIDFTHDYTEDISLRICGAGKAAIVMPLVRYTRGLPKSRRIVWVGEEFSAVKEIENCDALILSNKDINEYETLAVMSGKKIINVMADTSADPTLDAASVSAYTHLLKTAYGI